MSTFAIKQVITAGSQFDGQAPTTTPVTTNGVKVYPTDTQGGLFDPGYAIVPGVILEIQLKLADQASWSIVIVDGSDTFPVVSGTNETSYLYHPDNPLYLLPGQQIKLVTVGSSGAMFAIVIYGRASLGQS